MDDYTTMTGFSTIIMVILALCCSAHMRLQCQYPSEPAISIIISILVYKTMELFLDIDIDMDMKMENYT